MTTSFSTLDDEGDLTLPVICTVLVIIIYALLNGAVHNHAQIIQRMGREEEDSMTNEEFDTIGYRSSQSGRFRSARSSSDSLHEDLRSRSNFAENNAQNAVNDEDPLISRAGLFDYSPDDTMEETLSDASSDYSPRYSFTISPEEARLQKKLLNKDIFDIFNIDYVSDEDNDDDFIHSHDYFDFRKRSLFPKSSKENDQLEDRSPLYNEDYGYEDENADTEEDSSSIHDDSSSSSSGTSSTRWSMSEAETMEGDDRNVVRRTSFLHQRSSQPHETITNVEVLSH
eukprot:gene6759-7283_t